jgi:biotin carboxyl carrier protein
MVTKVGDGVYRVETDGRSEVVYVAGSPGALSAFWNGAVFRENERKLTVGQAAAGPAKAGPHDWQLPPLAAPMPGTVSKILVSPGAKVAKDQPVIVLEAMKMEIPLLALDDAVVSAVRCREGELVQADAVLVTFEVAS